MFEFEAETEVRGLFSTQPSLVKIGSLSVFVAFVVFGLFIPTALAVAVVMGVGAPAANWKGTAGAIAFCGVMAVIGAWCSCQFVTWLRGNEIDFRVHCVFVLAAVTFSAVIAAIAAALGVWPEMFLAAGAIVLICLLLGTILISVGQAFGGKK